MKRPPIEEEVMENIGKWSAISEHRSYWIRATFKQVLNSMLCAASRTRSRYLRPLECCTH